MRMRGRALATVALVALLAGCGGDDTAAQMAEQEARIAELEAQLTATTSTTTTSTTTTSTTTTTTTTMPTTTTTTVKLQMVQATVSVYDGWESLSGSTDVAQKCVSATYQGADFRFVGAYRQVYLADTATDEILGVESLGEGYIREDSWGFKFCEFRAHIKDVPMDRAHYRFTVEDDPWTDGIVLPQDELRLGVHMVFYNLDAEEERDRQRQGG